MKKNLFASIQMIAHSRCHSHQSHLDQFVIDIWQSVKLQQV